MSESEQAVEATSGPFVPAEFAVPVELVAERFRLEPLGPEHNDRDHDAWTSSIDHIHATPGYEDSRWPEPMSRQQNLADLEMHARHFRERAGFTYSVLAGDDVVGCVYIYPDEKGEAEAEVRSWVRASHAELDGELRSVVRQWLAEAWPFRSVRYAVGGAETGP